MECDDLWENPKIKHGKPTKWGWVVLYPKHFYLGKYVDIGAFTLIQAEYGVYIGHGVKIGGGVKIYSSDTISNKRGTIRIGCNVRIGANSVILPGVTIGNDVTIGALSLVKEDVNGVFSKWGGNPLRRIGISKEGSLCG